MFVTYRVMVKRIALFVKISILKEKNVFRWHQLWSFDGGLMRIKGAKNLYQLIFHSRHTASYTGWYLLDLMRWEILVHERIAKNVACTNYPYPASPPQKSNGLLLWQSDFSCCSLDESFDFFLHCCAFYTHFFCRRLFAVLWANFPGYIYPTSLI